MPGAASIAVSGACFEGRADRGEVPLVHAACRLRLRLKQTHDHCSMHWLKVNQSSPTTASAMVQVTQVKVPPRDCTTALQIGCGSKKAKRLASPQQSFYIKNELSFKAKLVRFVVAVAPQCPCHPRATTATALLPPPCHWPSSD